MNSRHYMQQEERPIIELPTLIMIGMILMSIVSGLSLLFLPLILVVGFWASILCIFIIFFHPHFGLFILLSAIYLQPLTFLMVLRPFHLVLVMSFITLFIWLIRMIVFKRFHLAKSILNFWTIGFALSALFSTYQNFDFSFPRFIDFMKMVILYFLITNLITDRRCVLSFIWVIVFLSAIIAAMGIFEHFSGIPILERAGVWVGTAQGGEKYETTATIGEHGAYSLFMIAALPFALGLMWNIKNKIAKLFLFGASFLLIMAIMFSFARSGLVALAAVVFLSVLRQVKKAFIYVIILLVVMLIASPFIPSNYWEHVMSILNMQDSSIRVRLFQWQAGLEMLKDRPFFGVGFQNFRNSFFYYVSPEGQNSPSLTPHNIFVEIASEMGVFGLLFLLALIYYALRELNIAGKLFNKEGDHLFSALSYSTQISLLGILSVFMFLSQGAYQHHFWMLVGLAAVMKNVSLEKNAKQN